MRFELVCLASVAVVSLVSLTADAREKGEPISAEHPWLRDPGDAMSVPLMKRLHGVDPADLDIEPFWQGNMLFTPSSATSAMLEQAGVDPSVHAMAYEPTPGILYVEMNGVTLSNSCGLEAHSAKNCTPLVTGEVAFPAFGDSGQQAAVFNELQGYYDPFNIVMSTSRPPEWVPYTMAVIGGSASLAGLGGGTCGVANVQCDGLQRNHVSLSFPQSCGGVPEIAAQEASHNWGLEHTSNQTDLMYPFVTAGFKTFVDDCLTISHATGKDVTQCDYVHEFYCEAGAGEEQNSYAELMGVFGPREADDEPPEILTITPEDGAAFSTMDAFDIRGTVAENSNFIAMKWTLEGADMTFTKCTNDMCDDDLSLGSDIEINGVEFVFTALAQAPEGEYTITWEVMDAYGGYDMRTITFYVNEDGEPPMTTDPTDPSGSSSDTDVSGSGTTAELETESGESDGDENDDDESDTDPTTPIDDGGTKEDCGCTTGGGASWLFAMLVGGVMRRRRRAA